MIRKTLRIILLAMMTAACTEKINVKLDTTYTRVVVDGNIQSDTGAYSIALTSSADYFSNQPVPRIFGAHVTINDGEKTFTLYESRAEGSGIYLTDSNFAGKIGKTYSLHVDLHDAIAGKTSVDATCALLSVTRLDSIAAVFDSTSGTEGRWFIKLWAQEPGDETNYYLFNLYRNGELMTDTITKKVISDDKFYNGSYMNGVTIMRINNAHKWETFSPGDTITLQMSGITKEYYNFVAEVDRSGFNLPFFTGPPANVVGNISNGGIGFFAAYSSSFAKTVVKKPNK